MRKRISFAILTLLAVVVLSACSAVSDVANSVDYVAKATDYINKVSDFYNQAPGLIEKAVTDANARKDLENQLNDLKKEIQAFNQLTPPDFAKDVHQTILDHNKKLEAGIDAYLNNVKNGQIDPQAFQGSELYQTFKDISGLLNQVQNLNKN
ncbi:DUF6376 family protein [Thermoflavimicrobium dichotomicum]|uniref:Lipoprotein n=1 Tax=Thermoflavimicrobium dichotomicum TaxID=46223 RepID=A0A1I3LP07_9BACL|nr:DUF6376 family protein [Thermoflavimicrobium dichotomicum]SFI86216.1 hypothetical protein SAMN05421852_102262 [Thermoflavimicrobium dichotomicum]